MHGRSASRNTRNKTIKANIGVVPNHSLFLIGLMPPPPNKCQLSSSSGQQVRLSPCHGMRLQYLTPTHPKRRPHHGRCGLGNRQQINTNHITMYTNTPLSPSSSSSRDNDIGSTVLPSVEDRKRFLVSQAFCFQTIVCRGFLPFVVVTRNVGRMQYDKK